jgi:hypothetical protein
LLAEVHILEDCPVSGWDEEHLKLWAAVLYRGVIDYCKAVRKQRLGKRLNGPERATLRWFEDNEIRICSFAWVCQVLGLSHWWVRKKTEARVDFIATSRKLVAGNTTKCVGSLFQGDENDE